MHDKAFNIAKNPKHDRYQLDLLQWSIKFLIKKDLDFYYVLNIYSKYGWGIPLKDLKKKKERKKEKRIAITYAFQNFLR